jgi:hypothetical protein
MKNRPQDVKDSLVTDEDLNNYSTPYDPQERNRSTFAAEYSAKKKFA